jgi:hypothetical protein
MSRDITSKEKSDIRTLMRFMEIYCRENHFREKSSFIFNKIYQSGFKNRTRLLGGGDGGVHLSTSSTRRQRQQSYMNEGELVLDVKSIRKKNLMLCPECSKFLRYGLTLRLRCPYDPKPMCKKCTTHCYKGEYKLKIREIMKFSGIYLVKHGRLDMLYYYFR